MENVATVNARQWIMKWKKERDIENKYNINCEITILDRL